MPETEQQIDYRNKLDSENSNTCNCIIFQPYFELCSEQLWPPIDVGKVRQTASMSSPGVSCTYRLIKHFKKRSSNVLISVLIKTIDQQANRVPFISPVLCILVMEGMREHTFDLLEPIM